MYGDWAAALGESPVVDSSMNIEVASRHLVCSILARSPWEEHEQVFERRMSAGNTTSDYQEICACQCMQAASSVLIVREVEGEEEEGKQ